MRTDPADARLRESVHPADWTNPDPRGRYDLVVVGGGTAGLVSAMGAAGLGARVALVERDLLGGDCLNTGCVPSKAILRSARAAAEARRAPEVGVRVAGVDADFAAVMSRMRERRAGISPHDSAARLRAAGVDVYFGQARFTGRSALAVGDRVLTFRRAVIATGGRPSVPPIPGLADVPYLTSDTLFGLTEPPRRLAIIGAGPIGCEMAQAFARLGTEVTLLDQAGQLLAGEDADAAAIVARRMTADGVSIVLGAAIAGVTADAGGIRVLLNGAGPDGRGPGPQAGDRLLIATGREPNVDALELHRAGVAVEKAGVVVDDRLRTSNPRIFAAGDVCSRFKFTHAADAHARIVIRNALFFGRARASRLVIPWCTYTDPEVAHVGWYAADARRAGRGVETITIPLTDVDRAVVDEERDGFVRVHHERGRLLGCTVVSSRAGEMIGVAAHALTHGPQPRPARIDDLSVPDAEQRLRRRRRRLCADATDAAAPPGAEPLFPMVRRVGSLTASADRRAPRTPSPRSSDRCRG
jgi:pyruvate/2-oxoglutarate dehydrogenase complex dihydrolipoamide dehydrogenase (E3) component